MADAQPKKVSLLRSFRGAHVLLKLSFMTTLVLGALLLLELVSYVIFQTKYAELPTYFQSLSGYRVFGNSSDYRLGQGIGAADGEIMFTDGRGLISEAPVTIAKPEGTIRVVLTGGSALAGAGQTSGYEDVHAYPQGTYAWGPSISGQLLDYLRAELPGREIEVVNAAHNNKALHQNLIHYVESLCEYDADVLVSMDGLNEATPLCSDEPYQDWERMWRDAYVILDNKSKGIGGANKFYLTRLMGMGAEYAHESLRVGVAPPPPSEPYGEDVIREEYEKNLPVQSRRADRWLQILRQFVAVVRADEVGLVYALQPMVSRSTNKQLSEIEARFDERAIPRQSGGIGNWFPCMRYLWDDYLSPRMATIVEAGGGTYLDLGQAMQGLGPDMEFYTDYCHLTPGANTWIAEQLGQAVLATLRARGTIE